jgi:hypothetical protein
MKINRYGLASGLLATLTIMQWAMPLNAEPVLLAGGDIRTRQSGIKVGTPKTQQIRSIEKVNTPPPVISTPPIKVAPPTNNPPVIVTPPSNPPPVSVNVIPLPLAGLNRAQQATDVVNNLIGQGLTSQYRGLGRVAGEMVEITAKNTGTKTMNFNLVPGMVLEAPAGSGVQPLILEDNIPVTLSPGEQFNRRLNCYCLDYNVDPPSKGQLYDYAWAPTLNPNWADPIKVLLAGLKLDSTNQYNPIVRQTQHRRIVIQRAIWEVLGQRQDAAALKQAVQESSNNQLTKKTEAKIVDSVRRDMDKTIQAAKSAP